MVFWAAQQAFHTRGIPAQSEYLGLDRVAGPLRSLLARVLASTIREEDGFPVRYLGTPLRG